ncbi:MAG: hypothetical protein ACK4JB_12320 [Reyranella sp.]
MLPEESLIGILQTTGLGLVGLIAILGLNAFFIRRISLRFELTSRRNLVNRRYNGVFANFFLSVVFLALVQLGAIVIWAGLLRLFEVVDTPSRALLFAGSCYTTIGILSDITAEGWKLLAVFIAISGIFSFALSTATVLNMTPLYRRAWFAKHARKIARVMEVSKITLTESDEDKQLQIALNHAADG